MLNEKDEKTRLEIATKLKKIRLQKHLKQIDVFQKAGINSNYYARIVRGEINLSMEKLHEIISALGIKSSAILLF